MTTFGVPKACASSSSQARDRGRLSARQAASPPRSVNARVKPCAASWRAAALPSEPLSSYTTTGVAVASQGWWLRYSRKRSMGRAGMPGAKKGAHYSARVPFGTPAARPPGCASRARVAAAALAWMVLGGAPLPAAPAGHPEADARKAEAELQAVKSEIERITRQVSLEQVERDRLTQELRTSELSVGKLRDEL